MTKDQEAAQRNIEEWFLQRSDTAKNLHPDSRRAWCEALKNLAVSKARACGTVRKDQAARILMVMEEHEKTASREREHIIAACLAVLADDFVLDMF